MSALQTVTDVVDPYAPGSYGGIRCGNCRQTSSFDSCMRDANHRFCLPLSQWRCPRCAHHWEIVRRPSPDQPGRKYIVVNVIRQGAIAPRPAA